MINVLQTNFGKTVTSNANTLFVDLDDYSKGPVSSFSAGLVQYFEIHKITSPPFKRFTFYTGSSSNKIYDVPYILSVLIPARMGDFYYHD